MLANYADPHCHILSECPSIVHVQFQILSNNSISFKSYMYLTALVVV